MTGRAVESHSPIFVVGRGRSGTTLMASLLDAHPRLTMLPVETEIFTIWLHKIRLLGLHRPEDVDRLWSMIISDVKFKKLDIEAVWQRLNRESPLAALRSFLTAIGEMDAEKWNKQRWGEKTPRHWVCIGRIFEAYPEARIVMMLRDPRAIFASLRRVPWNRENAEKSARQWLKFIEEIQRRSTDRRVRVVTYESLVTQTQTVLEDLCMWLGEEYSTLMLDRSVLVHRLTHKKGWELEHRRKTLESITADGLDRWKNELKQGQVRVIEHLCGDRMREYGYKPVTGGLSLIPATILKVKSAMIPANNRLKSGKKIVRRIFHKFASPLSVAKP